VTVFSGLCVGGPFAGRRYSHAHYSFPVVSQENFPPLAEVQAAIAIPDAMPKIKRTYYHHEEFSVGRDVERFGF
jgi:hypothetical protein